METYTEKLNDNQIQLLKKKYYNYISDKKIPYALFQIKLEDCTITVYTSKKAVYQGEKASLYLTQPLEEDEAGSDEVGTGDYFGPVTVCAVLVKKEDIAFLKELQVNDSKQINDDQIRQKAPLLIKRLTHSLLILDNIKYNQIHTINNMNQIKAKLHNQAYLHLQKKAGSLPERCIVDQFAPKDLYYRYLQNDKSSQDFLDSISTYRMQSTQELIYRSGVSIAFLRFHLTGEIPLFISRLPAISTHSIPSVLQYLQ